MSWRHSQAAGLLDYQRPPAKAVLLTLCHHADQFTGICWPDLDRIMQFTGLARRTVQIALRELEALGVVETETGSRGRANTYTLRLPGCEPVEQDSKGARPARGGASPAPRGASPAPQQSWNNQEHKTRAALAVLPDDWAPTPDQVQAAKKEFTTCDVEHETMLFIDISKQKGTEYADVNAAWRAWLRRGETYAQRDQRTAVDRSPRPQRGGDALRKAAARARGQGAGR